MNPELVRMYREYRAKEWTARQACTVARYYVNEKPKWYIDRLPSSDSPEEVDVPGVGTLEFTTLEDSDHNEFERGCGQEFEWIRYGNDYADRHDKPCGSYLGADRYSLGHTENGKLLIVEFSELGGMRLEDRRRYESKAGYSRQDAELRARQSIRRECDYWYKVHNGDIFFCGFKVRLYTYDSENCEEVELGEESCYGYEWEGDKGYPLDEVNGWAKRLVEAHWPGGDEVPMPETLTKPIPTTEAAWRAWRTTMITSHDDRSIADPIFVATYKEHNHAG